MRRAPRLFALATVLSGGLLAMGCADEVHTGTIAKVPLVVGPLGARQGAPLTVAPPRDVRPAVEHQGEEDRTRFFFTVAVVTHWERAGNYVTNDEAASPIAAPELRQTVAEALTASRAATVMPEGAPSNFTLETEIEHLYATHYAVTEGTVVVIPSKRKIPVGGGASAQGRQYASYGNVVLKARLVDRRSGTPVVVWEEHVIGTGQALPSREHVEAAQTALRMAVSDAVGALSLRVGAALDRLGQGPNGSGYVLTEIPSVFLIERVSRFRDFLETVYVETRSGRVLRHDIAPLIDHAHGRPGEWLVSRRTPEGIVLSGDGYEALARALAEKYDLRAYDDLDRYHFFGVRGAVPAPAGQELESSKAHVMVNGARMKISTKSTRHPTATAVRTGPSVSPSSTGG